MELAQGGEGEDGGVGGVGVRDGPGSDLFGAGGEASVGLLAGEQVGQGPARPGRWLERGARGKGMGCAVHVAGVP
ncbi:hypothetical protein GCM10018980_76290 [Streptomyces capoamus]|uniref:Uncharacterized protein n=1 Tax=Streptomyces capoamus TaxID=68183 RepID=A0A919F3U7_9ACTN|nr:hypothetical protein GCM10010501_15240 [Streptomyces libani subsp. rufus]GHG77765.1 hypothetical protein GCM10018980_76290 [Streptomyces capoamus]